MHENHKDEHFLVITVLIIQISVFKNKIGDSLGSKVLFKCLGISSVDVS